MINAVSSSTPNQGGNNNPNAAVPPSTQTATDNQVPESRYSSSLSEKINTPISQAPGASNASIPPVPPPPTATGNFASNSDEGNGGDAGNKNKKKVGRRFSAKMIVGAVLLFLLILGSGAGLYLSQQSQDIRQQADVDCSILEYSICQEPNNGCIWNGTTPTTETLSCSDYNTAAECGRYSSCSWSEISVNCIGGSGCSIHETRELCESDSSCRVAGVNQRACTGGTFTREVDQDGQCVAGNDSTVGIPPGGEDITTTGASCEAGGNQIPHGSTACNQDDRSREFVCNNGSWEPGNSCGTGTCQGTNCTGVGSTNSCNGSMCTPTCSDLSCNISCQNGSGCQTFRKTFVCEGRRGDGCPATVDIGSLHKSNDASIDPSNSQYWCKTVQLDVHASVDAGSGAQSSDARVIYIGNNGDYCVERGRDRHECFTVNGAPLGNNNPSNLNWNCGEEILSCNDTCSNDAQCTEANANYRCLPTFSFGSNESFQNGSGILRPSGQGSHNLPTGTLQSVSRFIASSAPHIRQQVVIDGQIYGRTSNDNNSWEHYTYQFYGLPSQATNVTSFSAYENANGHIVQHVVANGLIWYRSPQTNNSWVRIHPRNTGAQGEPRLNLPSHATGTITHYSVMKWGSVVDQRVVIGGQVWYRQGTPAPEGNFSDWENVTSYFPNGSGNITSYVNHIDQDGTLKQHYVRGGQLWYRTNNSEGNKCRLAQSVNSDRCTILPPPPTIPPTPTPLQCDSSCNPTDDQCPGDLRCIRLPQTGPKCRLPSNSSDASCRPPAPMQCNSACNPNTGDADCAAISNTVEYFCYQGACRRRDNPTDAQCRSPQPLTCNQICNPTAQQGQAGACAVGLTCHPTQGMESDSVVHRCRLPGNLNNPACAAAPQCASIQMNIVSPNNNTEPRIGDSVNFTCGLVNGVDRYSFEVTVPGASPSPLPVSSNQINRSINLPINVHGTYNAQCFLNVNYGNGDNGGGSDEDEPPVEPGVCGVDYNCADMITCGFSELPACGSDGTCRCNPSPNPTQCSQASDCTNTCPSGHTKVCRQGACGCIPQSGGGTGGGELPGGTGGGSGTGDSCQLASDCRNTCRTGQVRTCIEATCGCATRPGGGGGGGGTSNM